MLCWRRLEEEKPGFGPVNRFDLSGSEEEEVEEENFPEEGTGRKGGKGSEVMNPRHGGEGG